MYVGTANVKNYSFELLAIVAEATLNVRAAPTYAHEKHITSCCGKKKFPPRRLMSCHAEYMFSSLMAQDSYA